jgi:adenine phosphoribosyltransferase
MKYEYYDKCINKNTKGRCDVTPVFEDPKVFSNLIDDLVKPFKDVKFNKIVGLDALGFIIGGALSNRLKIGFVPVRKGGKLPGINDSVLRDEFVDYTKKSKSFEINKFAIKKGDKVLIVDEWIETGTQVKSAIKLIEKLGGEVVGISTLAVDKSEKTNELFDDYNLRAIKIFEKG